MGDYTWMHLKYTIPPAVVLSFLYRPLLSRLDLYKIVFLVTIAVVSTTPWDSYLIRRGIWSYPREAVLGPTVFAIPLEELFFFVIQTYITSVLYLLLSKATFYPSYLLAESSGSNVESTARKYRMVMLLGLASGAICLYLAASGVRNGGPETYMGLIILWAFPFLMLLWSLSYQLIIGLPFLNIALPILVPTLYLWVVDTLALKRGTWVIEPETKLGIYLWDGLEIEEAVFFLLTNTLVVLGMVAFDNALAVLYTFPDLFPHVPAHPGLVILLQTLFTSPTKYDHGRLQGLTEAVQRLKRKSRSFYLASSTFEGRLRIDLILLYSFCRTVDDLVDDAADDVEAQRNVTALFEYLRLVYKSGPTSPEVQAYIKQFPSETHSAFSLLPSVRLPQQPLHDLLKGLESDLAFTRDKSHRWPIHDEKDLELYAFRVASTIAELCISLTYSHCRTTQPTHEIEAIIASGRQMGLALQFINISRDIATDAKIGRVYLPTTWLKEHDLTPEMVLEIPNRPELELLRQRLLSKAMKLYRHARPAIEELPPSARGPMRVAVESYVEIGRVLLKKGYRVKAGRATVPKLQRLRVAWKALSNG